MLPQRSYGLNLENIVVTIQLTSDLVEKLNSYKLLKKTDYTDVSVEVSLKSRILQDFLLRI